MKVHQLHSWLQTKDEAPQAMEIQRRLAAQVVKEGKISSSHFIGGVDISSPNTQGVAAGAVVVLSYPELTVAEVKMARQSLTFSYIPGLLSFRESPVILAACEKLVSSPDFVLVDGQGIAHPRHLGIASHLGLLLNVPTIGCAKSRLWGNHGPVGEKAGSFAMLKEGDEVIGAALRTKADASPVYVSIGHKVDLETAIYWVMQCCRDERIPEPLRLAHLAAAGQLPENHPETAQEMLQGRLLG